MRVPSSLTEPLGAALGAGFARLAARRGGEGVHTAGVRLTGTLAVEPRSGPPGVPLLARPDRYGVQVRLSWGVGPFRGLPDVPGLGLRVLDADGAGGIQDLLLDGSRPAPRDRVLVVRRTLAGWYGTPLRLRLGTPDGPKVQVAARLRWGGRGRLGLADVRADPAAVRGLLLLHGGGRVLGTGRLELHAVTDPTDPDAPRFDLGADAGGLVSAGFWHDLRARAYADSRAGDPRPSPTRTGAAPTG